jgi:addiction module RelE/StbE family toxin
MWSIEEKRTLQKSIRRIPRDVLVSYEAWKRIVELQGPSGLKAIPGFHDEALKGDWAGYRSSRLSLKWRVIYFVEGKELLIFVVEVNPHKY